VAVCTLRMAYELQSPQSSIVVHARVDRAGVESGRDTGIRRREALFKFLKDTRLWNRI